MADCVAAAFFLADPALLCCDPRLPRPDGTLWLVLDLWLTFPIAEVNDLATFDPMGSSDLPVMIIELTPEGLGLDARLDGGAGGRINPLDRLLDATANAGFWLEFDVRLDCDAGLLVEGAGSNWDVFMDGRRLGCLLPPLPGLSVFALLLSFSPGEGMLDAASGLPWLLGTVEAMVSASAKNNGQIKN